MRILFITEKFPYPLDTGGNVRTYHLLRGLAGSHQVTVVAENSGDVDPAHVEHVAGFCHEVVLAEGRPQPPWADALVLLRSLFDSSAVVIARRYRASLAAVIRDLMTRKVGTTPGGRNFDAVYFNHLDASVYMREIPHPISRILDEHNVVTSQVKTMAASAEGLVRRKLLQRDVARVASYEARVASAMDLCLACSDVDAESLRSLGVTSRVVTIPNGVDTDFFQPAPPGVPQGPPTAVFVGTLDYAPCEQGVWHFGRNILPLLLESRPDLRFVAVGRNPSPRLKEMAGTGTSMVLTGRVEDVRPYMTGAQVCVVPLLSGSGTRLKILEAMAAGVPIVSTAIGAEGIEAQSGRHLWIADDPREFADRVLQVLETPAESAQMSMEARRLVVEKYSWSAVVPRLLAELDAMSGTPGGQ